MKLTTPANSPIFDDQHQRIRSSLAGSATIYQSSANTMTTGLGWTKRPGFHQTLEDAGQGKFSQLTVSSADRLSRDTVEVDRLFET